jgi:hypothetical protein
VLDEHVKLPPRPRARLAVAAGLRLVDVLIQLRDPMLVRSPGDLVDDRLADRWSRTQPGL